MAATPSSRQVRIGELARRRSWASTPSTGQRGRLPGLGAVGASTRR